MIMNELAMKWTKVKQHLFHSEVPFAKGLSKEKLFWIFIIGSIAGAYYEQILNLITTFFHNGTIVWEYRRGVIYGPFSPIYGVGAVLMTYLLLQKKRSSLKTFLFGCFIGGSFEYVISFLQETFIGTVSWDYHQHFLNIGGRTTIPFMIVWGMMALVFVKFLYPKISHIIESIPNFLATYLTKFMVVFMVLDMAISWTALARQTLRRNHIEPFTVVGEFFDKVYTDEMLSVYFPNMQVKDGSNYDSNH